MAGISYTLADPEMLLQSSSNIQDEYPKDQLSFKKIARWREIAAFGIKVQYDEDMENTTDIKVIRI